jgi:hypothetical protein
MQAIDIALDLGEGRGCCLSQSHDLVYCQSDDRSCRQLATRVDGQYHLGFVRPCKDRVTIGSRSKVLVAAVPPSDMTVLRINFGQFFVAAAAAAADNQ